MSIYRVKKYFDDSISDLSRSFSGVNENYEAILRRQRGAYTAQDFFNSLIGVGTMHLGHLEVSVNEDQVCFGPACQSFFAGICDRFFVGTYIIKVRTRKKTRIQYQVLQTGEAIGHEVLVAKSTYGTLGGFILPKNNIGHRKIFSNNHVLALTNRARRGDSIYTFETYPDVIATLENFVPISAQTPNTLDLAVAGLNYDVDVNCSNYIAARRALLNEGVYKVGASTGLRYGVVASIDYTDKISYGGFDAVFVNQTQIWPANNFPFSEPGDSGSLVFSRSNNAFVGLLFAGTGNYSLTNPADLVSAQLRQWKYI